MGPIHLRFNPRGKGNSISLQHFSLLESTCRMAGAERCGAEIVAVALVGLSQGGNQTPLPTQYPVGLGAAGPSCQGT